MSAATGSRVARFVASLALLAGCAIGVPWALIVAARARFGGWAPWHGVPAPGAWEWSTIRASLAERLTEATVADIVIRTCLAITWAAVVVLLVTVVVEAVHMVRHGGLAMPAIRGLGAPQSLARVIAAGLLVLVPTMTSSARAVARDGFALQRPAVAVGTQLVEMPGGGPAGSHHESPAARDNAVGLGATATVGVGGTSEYVVRAGDSVFGIAERLAGPEPAAVASFAEQLVEINLGRRMPDGERFTNAAYLDVGWVLVLPSTPTSGTADDPAALSAGQDHIVARGETLWSIADDELGDPARWPEIYEANRGRTFADGRTFDDPSLIQPGWPLDVPGTDAESIVEEDNVSADSPDAAPRDHDGGHVEPGEETSAEPGVAPSSEDPRPAPWFADVTADPVDHELVESAADAPRPSNRWIDVPVSTRAEPSGPATTDPASSPTGAAGALNDRAAAGSPDASAPLLTLGRAAMLSAGVLTLLTVRRRHQLRRARPRARLPEPDPLATTTERTLRSNEPGDRFLRVDLAVRAAAKPLVAAGCRVVAVTASDDGAIELHASGPARLDAPWVPTDHPCRHELPASVPVELIAESARGVGAPCPTLVQLARTLDGRDLYVDLEAVEVLEVGGPGHAADAIVTAVAATLAGSVLAEVTTLVGVGIDDAAFLGHRAHVPVRDPATAFARAAEAIGSTATRDRGTFELRTLGTGGESWEPAVVLLGAAVGTVTPPTDRTGLAVVSASPIHGPSYRLAPDDGAWTLRPLGVRCVPVGLAPGDLAALTTLLGTVAEEAVHDDGPVVATIGSVRVAAVHPDDDLTLAPIHDDPPIDDRDIDHDVDLAGVAASMPRPPILVRLIGPVSIRSADGREAEFEKSKAKELIAWLATHRERATRSGARTALWELDVRDATFANVVSEARRSLARLVAPPDGEEWIARTLTEALPLHEQVRTDADLVREALDAARLQPPDEAIATLRPAIELVVGMPFESTGYLWPEAEGIASQLVLLATTATAELAAHCLSVGDIAGVFDATARGLQVLPGHEELIGLRMRAHATAGDHAGVRLEWEQYERIVDADPWSDGEPSPTLVDLRRELLAR